MLNQFNVNIDEVLKQSMENEKPSVDFEDVWNKYKKTKNPAPVFKRMTALAAAVLVVVVSAKFISTNTDKSNGLISQNIALNPSIGVQDTTGGVQNQKGGNPESTLSLYSADNSKQDMTEINPKARTFEKGEGSDSEKAAAFMTGPALAMEKNQKRNSKAYTRSEAPSNGRVEANFKTKDLKTSDMNIAAQKSTTIQGIVTTTSENTTPQTITLGAAFVILNNCSYYKTNDLVEEKDLGEVLGKTIKQTERPENTLEGNGLPEGTILYEIRGEDPKSVIALKLGEVYYRAVLKK